MSFEMFDDKSLKPYDLPDSFDEEELRPEEEREDDMVRRLLAAYGF